jgi:hypothetical protein
MIPPELCTKIRRLFYAEHWRVGTIASTLGVHPDTVQRAIERDRFVRAGSQIRPSLLDPYKAFIMTTLEQYPRLRATRLSAMLHDRGFAGTAVQVRRYVRTVRPAARAEAYLRLDTMQAEQGQVDWGNFGPIQIGRARRSLSCFVLVLSWSRAVYARFALDQTLESFLRGHVAAFSTLGGVPRVLLPEYVAHIFGHDGLGDAAKELKGALVARDPVRDLLGARRFRVGVVRGPQHGDEELDVDHLAGGRVDDRRLLAGVVYEALLAGAMDLAHREAPALEPPTVDVAELGVPVAVRMLLEIFQMEQLEGDARLAPLGVQGGAVGDGAMAGGWRRRPIHPGLQGLVAEGLDLAPREAGPAGAQDGSADGAATDPQALRHLPVGAPEAPLLSQDLPCLAHGQSLGGHPSPFRGRAAPADGPASLCFGQRPDHDAPIPVITMPIFLITIDRSA